VPLPARAVDWGAMRDPARHVVTPAVPRAVAQRAAAAGSTRAWELLAAIGAALIAATVCFYHLGSYGLWEPDEARYAEIAREMLVLRDFITPHLDYVPYIEKPPLLYWLTAFSMRVGGVNELAARLPNATAALVGIGAVYLFTRRVFDQRQGILAAVILSTSALYGLMAQVLTTDMLLTACLCVALFAFYLQWAEGGAWWWLMYLAIGFGVLVKGPIAMAIPALAGGIFLLTAGGWRGAARRFHLATGFGLVALTVAPWFIAITLRQPNFLAFYLVGEHLQRFFEASYSHGQPIWYYVPVILGGVLPWSLVVPFIRWRSLTPSPARRFCLITAATIFVLFSLASAKLIPYILPAMPFVAVLLANGLDDFIANRDCRPLALVGPLLGIAAVGVWCVAALADRFRNPNPLLVRPALQAGVIVLSIAGVLCFATFWQRRAFAGLASLAVTSTVLLVVASYGRLMAEPARSYAGLARLIAQRAPTARLVCYPRYIESLPFYTGRRVTLVGAPTELAYGAAHASDGSQYFFTHRPDLLRLWNAPVSPLLIVDRSAMPQLVQSLGPFTIVAADQRKIAIMRAGSRSEGTESGE
jgi:4-amino-4-deoxy-L-arabinose transferase-like glycosyltransferase